MSKQDDVREANEICQHSPIRVGWAMRTEGEFEIILGFDRPMHGIGIPVKDAEKLIAMMRETLDDVHRRILGKLDQN